MKAQLFALFCSLFILGIRFCSFAQCDLGELTIVQNNTQSPDGNCTINVTVSFTIEKNPGNKYTYIHLWARSDYPDFGYKKAPDKSDLGSVLATVSIFTDGPAKLLQNYGPDNTVPTLYAGLTLNEEVLDDKLYKITISNLIINYLGSCNKVVSLKGDIWSTQSEADKHPPVHCVSSALPVSLVKFKGELLDNAIGLSWVTNDENSSSHFQIERSRDLSEFVSIGNVKSAGTTNFKQYYNFVDKAPGQGANYYRLKMIDLDGKTEFSKIIYVENNAESVVFQLLGNPVRKDEIKFIAKNIDLGTLVLFDINGKRLNFHITRSGNLATLKPTANLHAGLYVLRLNDAAGIIRKVMVLPE